MGTDTMSNRRILLLALGSGAGLLSLGVRALTPGAAAPAAPGGFADPQGAPRRLPPPDVDPVWRGPSVDTLATLRRRGLIRVGVVPIEPMVMQDAKGAWLGFSVDLARRLADDLGVRLELVPTSWPRVIPDLLERQYDVIITGLWITAPRALVVNFTQPTVTEGLHLVASSARAARRLKRSDYNQSDVTLAVGAGTPQERMARLQFPRARLLSLDDGTELVAVRDGRALAALVPTISPEALVDAAGDGLFMPLAEPLARVSTAMAVRKGDPDWLSFLNTWLDLQREQGWLDERARHWASPAAAR
jgi:polar amino acid transport system substrate-binding protein